MLSGRKRSHPSALMMQTPIVDSKYKLLELRSKQVMTIFQKQSELISNAENLPTGRLKPDTDFSAYNTPLLKEYSVDIQLIWGLAVALFQSNSQSWIRNLVLPGLESQLEINLKQHDDPFVTTFTYLSFGQRDLACQEAKRLEDFQLSMYITHSGLKDVRETVQDHIKTLQTQGKWQNMTPFHKRSWRTISGKLDYSEEDGFTVTERVSWQCCLGMYIWYGNRFGDVPSLQKYNTAIDSSIVNIHHLTTVKNTAAPDVSCLWYQLFQWWLGDKGIAKLDSWPLDLVWLLTVYKPSGEISDLYAMKWIENLEKIDQSESAIYAALFLKRPVEKVNQILRQCEWNNESKLLNEYHIPSKIICFAKALNAHDDWDFDEEYRILLEGGLYKQAKMSLLHFILPRYFDSECYELQLSASDTKLFS
ncbi:hypothetical protein INT47_003038 [Mucor saturninus]|uniref:Nuclear pore complex protein NUP96 C-terminal domain-containing protein n=1 Tax=Mucor saturninus TaxID=64648 RepID=A0A8H7QU47_9FUNG|nr:hypothetical protein INT47_003038 [Mucor saturninus]